MRIARGNSWRGWRMLAAPAALALLVLFFPSAGHTQKKDAKKGTQRQSTAADRLTIDTSNLVWPQPPAIARIKFTTLYTGEKIDFKAIAAAPKKPKQSWMD